MWEYLGLFVALGLIVLWCLGVYAFHKRGLLEPRGLHAPPPPAGPFLMWKTVRGRRLIERLARPKRLWKAFGDLSIVLVGITMAGTTLLLLWEATLVESAAVRGNPPAPELLLGLPGINPIIPLGYGIFGLAVAIVLHEFSHGILSRAADIRIKSLGVILLIFPIGAFVEPDEDELRALPRRERARLYAAGPATNILLAILFAFLFSSVMMASVTPVHDGVGIIGFTENGSPSQAAGMEAYTVITEVNGMTVRSYLEFRDAMAVVSPGQNISVTTYDPATSTYESFFVILAAEPGTNRPLLGIFAMDVSTEYYHPLTNPDRFGGAGGAILTYISLPFQGRAPIQDPALRFYQVGGPLAALPPPLFWVLANTA